MPAVTVVIEEKVTNIAVTTRFSIGDEPICVVMELTKALICRMRRIANDGEPHSVEFLRHPNEWEAIITHNLALQHGEPYEGTDLNILFMPYPMMFDRRRDVKPQT